MRQVREIIRLKFSGGIPTREIARRLGVAASTVRETLRRFEVGGLGWPLPNGMSDGDLEAALYANHGTKRGHRRHVEPDWPTVHRELKRKHVTLVIVWDEYIAANPGGYSYSRFCELYRGFESKLSPTMRQTHAAGERLFVDYAGDGVPVVIDRLTGEIRNAQVFVAVLGASSFTFAHASWTQALPDWIDAHVHAFAAIGGVPHLLVPDNTKTAVIKACLYDPQVNRTYAEMAAHYDTAILPARPRRPRDKAKVEQAVLIVERWLLGRLRHRTFYSLAEVNAATGELMTARPPFGELVRFARKGLQRRAIDLFEQLPAATTTRSSIQRVPRLFEALALARGDGRHPRLLRNLGRADLLILDDWGLEPLDAAARHDLLEILEERYGRRSTMITSQLPVDRWHEIIGDPTYADAILDRLVHNAHRIELAGESMRRTRGKQNQKA